MPAFRAQDSGAHDRRAFFAAEGKVIAQVRTTACSASEVLEAPWSPALSTGQPGNSRPSRPPCHTGSMRAAASIQREASTLTPAQEAEMRRMDPNGDGIVDEVEKHAFAKYCLPCDPDRERRPRRWLAARSRSWMTTRWRGPATKIIRARTAAPLRSTLQAPPPPSLPPSPPPPSLSHSPLPPPPPLPLTPSILRLTLTLTLTLTKACSGSTYRLALRSYGAGSRGRLDRRQG